jgi:hypothetical protein
MKSDDVMLTLWKQQVDTGLRIVEEMAEGTVRMHEIQLEAAVEAHASAVATQQSLAGAGNASEVWQIQAECLLEGLRASAAFWSRLWEAAIESNSSIIRRLYSEAQPGVGAASKAASTEVFNTACEHGTTRSDSSTLRRPSPSARRRGRGPDATQSMPAKTSSTRRRAMSKEARPVDPERLFCEVCLRLVPKSEALTAPARDYVAYFCSLNCYESWQGERAPELPPHEVQLGHGHSKFLDERIKDVLKQHPTRDEPRLDSIERDEIPRS